MDKKILLTGLIGIVILGGIIFWSVKSENKEQNNSKSNNEPATQEAEVDDNGIILFYGNGCPHCENVDKFVQENKVEEKVEFKKLEVFSSKENSKIMAEKFKACGLPAENMGVPFLWDGEKCYSGDVDIIEFFKQKINQ